MSCSSVYMNFIFSSENQKLENNLSVTKITLLKN